MGKLITLPFAALLRLMYSITQSYGLSIILFSLVITLIMVPLQMKSKRSMIRMGRLSGKQAELQKQYAKNQQKYQEELAKLFQRFYRGRAASGEEGVGVGLYLVRQIAQGQGGYVKAFSRPGKGARFSLFLPRN